MKKNIWPARIRFALILLASVGGLIFFLRIWPSAEETDSRMVATLPDLAGGKPIATLPRTQVTGTIMAAVPFISQAPRAQWNDPIFQDGCEEASLLMAMNWANGTPLNLQDATNDILKMVEFEKTLAAGYEPDLSVTDTAAILRDYFHYPHFEIKNDVRATTLIEALKAGKLIIAPVNGQLLPNPYFTPPGPLYHMLVIIGYDPRREEFITHDPGTRRGAKFRYPAATFMAALRDYPTGHHELITEKKKRVIILAQENK